MTSRLLVLLSLISLLALVCASVMSAFAAGNTVPVTRLTDQSHAITANALKPPECAALNLVRIVVCPSGGGNCNGTNQADLVLGSPNVDNINGRQGNDCILGGGGDDTINGFVGNNDVCIGGPGNDTFLACETIYQ